jgi:hypothetical protein
VSAPEDCIETGCACHGWPVTVWVVGPATQDEADDAVERLLGDDPDATVVRA